MQGFHMTPNFEIFISEITLFWPDYTTKRITPRSSEVTLQLQCLYLETLLEIAGLLGIFLEQGGLFLALRYLIVEPETGF